MNKKTIITIAMCLAIFLVMLDTTIMNITLPAIQKGLNVGLDSLSWALNIYTIIFATCTIPLSKLADIYGKGKILIIGLVLFGIGSLISGLAMEFYQLILGRVIASLGASILLPVGNILGISSWKVEDRFKIVAALGLTQGGAAAIGPTLGGIITDSLSWHWIFFINIPIVIMALLLLIKSFDFKKDTTVSTRIDWYGSLISMISLCLLTLGLIKVRDWGFNDWKSITCFSISIITGFLFIIIEKQNSSPMINLNLFRIKEFSSASLVAFIAQFFYIGVIVILPTFFTTVQGKSELDAALILLPMSLTVFIFGGLGSLAINKLGPRLLVFTGLLAILISYILLITLDPNNTLTMSFSTLVLGIGFGIIAGPINVLAASTLDGGLLTASQSIISVVRQIGSVIGVSVFISILTNNIKILTVHTPQEISEAYLSIYKIWIPYLFALLLLSLLFAKRDIYLQTKDIKHEKN